MARVLAKHGIEQFVIFWISKFRNKANIRSQRKFIEKAIKQISFFLNPPCCVDPEATIEFRRLDNDLTRYIAAAFANKLDKRKWRKSLERAKTELENLLIDPCCPDIPIQGTIRVDADGGVADIIFVTAAGQGSAVYVSGDDLLPQTAGQTGEFTFLSGILEITVYGEGLQTGLNWKITGSDGVIQEAPYAGGFSHLFSNVAINSIGPWIVEIVPE